MSDAAASQVASKEFEFTLESKYGGDGETVPQTYHYIYGDPNSAAIYLSATDVQAIRPGQIRPPTFQDLLWCLEFELFDIEAIVSFFDLSTPGRNLYYLAMTPEGHTLRALGIAHKIYQSLPTATVSTRALNHPLDFPRWAQDIHKRSKIVEQDSSVFDRWGGGKADFQLSQPVAFSCVAWLEAGVDINPLDLDRVFALAYEDSIYVSMNLTCDPWEAPCNYELKRVAGNVGKPGITLLIPPDDPVGPTVEESSWRVIGTSEFNGRPEDSFSHTSMHLSFTEYYFPLVRSNDGQGQDKPVHYLESVVSIHDAGQWIGDVDLQKCFASRFFTRWRQRPCGRDHGTYSGSGIRSIESWEDVIDHPPRDAVVRAHGNWVARLATTAVLIRLQEARGGGFEEVSVFSNDGCWMCASKNLIGHETRKTSQSTRYMPGISKIVIY